MGIELLTFLFLALVAEGVLLALFPAALRRMMAEMTALPPARLRAMGVIAAVAGVVLLWVLARLTAGPGAGGVGLGFDATRRAIGTLLGALATGTAYH